jgi:hypothetical protein
VLPRRSRIQPQACSFKLSCGRWCKRLTYSSRVLSLPGCTACLHCFCCLQILVLDEPLSSLDSFAALQLTLTSLYFFIVLPADPCTGRTPLRPGLVHSAAAQAYTPINLTVLLHCTACRSLYWTNPSQAWTLSQHCS